ncbi:MAG: voltage-gated potassium channel [Candidatus Azotimanducaceae bacterium]|jgi:voltage-gated potassium channel
MVDHNSSETDRASSRFGKFTNAAKDILKRRDFRGLARFIFVLAALISGYSILFQFLMAYEGQQHSLVTGVYWTLSTMSTLGFGDITFLSDVGRTFSILVLLSGIVFLLILLPFTFIELFYEPWMEARASSRIPRAVPDSMKDHVILTFYDPVASALIEKLKLFNYPYVVVLSEVDLVTSITENGIHAICGELDNPDTWIKARVSQAVLVATTRDDIANTSVVFTIRGITESTPVIATARAESSVEILKLAGCNRILDLPRLMAEALVRRIAERAQFSHVIGRVDDLLIAEVNSSRTTLVGKGYLEAQRITSISIVGFWERGSFEIAQPESVIEDNTVLLMAGSADQFKEFNASSQAKQGEQLSKPVIIIGGGRVGRATAAALARRGQDYRIVEKLEERIPDKIEIEVIDRIQSFVRNLIQDETEHKTKYVIGSAAEKDILERAGIADAQTVIITPRDDETNIYLTIFCRLLRPDIQIISRATLERSLPSLHRAGCDIAMSYASMGANALFNLLHRSDLLMIAEGLDVFKIEVPKELAGKTLAEANFRQTTNCSVIGIDAGGKTMTNPTPESIIPEIGEIVLIGTPAAETDFLRRYPE